MTDSEKLIRNEAEAIECLKSNKPTTGYMMLQEAVDMAIQALEKQEKIKEIIANANQWSKEDIVVKAQAFCDIEKILRSDEE